MNLSRRTLTTIVKISISAILVYWLFRRIGLNDVLQWLLSASWGWILMSISAFSLSNMLGAWQWYLLIRSKKINLGFWQVVSFYHIGLFFNNFLISYVGGDAFRIYDVRKRSGDLTTALSTVFFDRFIGFLALTSLSIFVSLFYMRRLGSHVSIYPMASLFLMWSGTLFLLFHERSAKRCGLFVRFFFPKVVYRKFREIYYSINLFKNDKTVLLQAFAIALFVQSLRILTHYGTARAMGVHGEIYIFFIFIPLVATAASLPISVGGIGVREQSSVTLFGQVGFVGEQVVAFELLAYFVSILTTLPGGIIFALRRERHHTVQVTESA